MERNQKTLPFDIEDLFFVVALMFIAIGSFKISSIVGFLVTGFTILAWITLASIIKAFLINSRKR